MRLFAGLDLPDDVIANLAQLLKMLRPTARIRWSPVENLHVTTKFIGEWPEGRLDELREELRSLPGRNPIEIEIRGVGYFPNPHHPRVFWAAVHGGSPLAELAGETDRALAGLGIPTETRAFSPHLTLARITEDVPLLALKRGVASLDSVDFGKFTVDRFFLYLSKPGPVGSVYTKLGEFPFAKAAE